MSNFLTYLQLHLSKPKKINLIFCQIFKKNHLLFMFKSLINNSYNNKNYLQIEELNGIKTETFNSSYTNNTP